ncbi:hypothetical protein [Ruminococcus sp. HUN007]|uniref:hypothetical protein n=1 Tax=Ruminococcus sp. HUN007 TaxID=1514668 RepID=UPI0005D215C5|nr:hypothetical protein [Ruminococcus sp. HUN007]
MNKINNTQQIINTALSAESSFNTIDEVVEYTDKVIMEYKKKLCLIISSLSSDILTDELESNIATLNVLMSLNAELKRIRELLNLNNNEKNTSQNNAELNASKKIYELTVFSDFTKMKVKSIKLMNSTYEVKGMDEAFSIICYVLRSINKDKISYLVNRYLIVAEKKVKIFSYYCEEQGFQPLGNSGIYYNINDMTNEEIVLTIRILLQFYDLRPEADLVFYATDIDA